MSDRSAERPRHPCDPSGRHRVGTIHAAASSLPFVAALMLRLSLLPFSETVEADAVTRTFMGVDWLAAPKVITHGFWAPLHTYLIAGALWLFPDPVLAPQLLNVLFASATVVPLYYFTRDRFDERGASFVAWAYALYPIAVRNSLMALAEVPFAFFLAMSMWLVSRAADRRGSVGRAVLGGGVLTLACALRFEGWILLPFVALSMRRCPKTVVAFLVTASIFPLFWMAGSYAHYGEVFHSAAAAERWELVVEGANQGLTTRAWMERLAFFPAALMFGLTPFVACAAVLGFLVRLRAGLKDHSALIGLLPFLALFLLLFARTLQGIVPLKTRYSLSLGLLLLPYCSVALERLRTVRARTIASLLLIGSIIPLGLALPSLPLVPTDIYPIPRLKDRDIEEVSRSLNRQASKVGDGLVLDFFGWEATYYTALMTKKEPNDIFLLPGGRMQELDDAKLTRFLDDHRTGTLLLQEESRFTSSSILRENEIEIPALSVALSTSDCVILDRFRICQYEVQDRP